MPHRRVGRTVWGRQAIGPSPHPPSGVRELLLTHPLAARARARAAAEPTTGRQTAPRRPGQEAGGGQGKRSGRPEPHAAGGRVGEQGMRQQEPRGPGGEGQGSRRRHQERAASAAPRGGQQAQEPSTACQTDCGLGWQDPGLKPIHPRERGAARGGKSRDLFSLSTTRSSDSRPGAAAQDLLGLSTALRRAAARGG